ncbi:MAG: hypothetical protein ACREUU_17585, partial [Gammaproteobacteria bacterium]
GVQAKHVRMLTARVPAGGKPRGRGWRAVDPLTTFACMPIAMAGLCGERDRWGQVGSGSGSRSPGLAE